MSSSELLPFESLLSIDSSLSSTDTSCSDGTMCTLDTWIGVAGLDGSWWPLVVGCSSFTILIDTEDAPLVGGGLRSTSGDSDDGPELWSTLSITLDTFAGVVVGVAGWCVLLTAFSLLTVSLFLCNSSPSLKLESVSEMMVSLSRSPSATAAARAGALGEGVGTIFGSGVATGCAFNVPRDTPRGGGAGAGGLAFFAFESSRFREGVMGRC
uniref:(northern house mosquito) hypothetical protein n=1 Tax=Culex pipiens TaxID=7175 RepID=A0A8D8E422_CULPI